jgi:uncharacterized HhH-GPD family protein
MTGDVYITGDAEQDGLINRDGTALLIGMQLDQQVPMEWAFMGPHTLKQRLGHLDATRIATMDENAFVAVCCDKPAIHRFPAVMGRRIHAMCVVLADRYRGQPEQLWATAGTGSELYDRLRELPGYGEEKSQIFVALLAKRFGVRPRGWKTAAGVFADNEPRTIADCRDEASLAKVREWKRVQRQAKKDKQGRQLPQRAG